MTENRSPVALRWDPANYIQSRKLVRGAHSWRLCFYRVRTKARSARDQRSGLLCIADRKRNAPAAHLDGVRSLLQCVETETKAAADRLDLAIRPRRNRRTEWAPRLVRKLD